jgi:lysophospholipase L1-like esterase
VVVRQVEVKFMRGARSRSLVSALVVAGVLVVGAALPAAAKGKPPSGSVTATYVAMGDSYASGNGTFAADLDYTCYRSSKAYAPLVATALGSAKLTFVACSGATTADIIGGQDRALSRKTTHVSISIGGNDVGFSDLIRACVFGGDSTCKTAVDSTNAAISSQLPAQLSATYAAIKVRAPKATVVVVGYPRVFNTGDVSCSQANGISDIEAGWLNQVSDDLDGAITTAAATAGFRYVDPNATFAGHDVCANDPYVNGIGPLLADSRSVYHPTANGHAKGFAPLVTAALRG